MYHIFFTHSSVDRLLSCFYVLAIVLINSAATDIGIHVCFWIMVFSGHMPSNVIAGPYGSSNFYSVCSCKMVCLGTWPIFLCMLCSSCRDLLKRFNLQHKEVPLSWPNSPLEPPSSRLAPESAPLEPPRTGGFRAFRSRGASYQATAQIYRATLDWLLVSVANLDVKWVLIYILQQGLNLSLGLQHSAN